MLKLLTTSILALFFLVCQELKAGIYVQQVEQKISNNVDRKDTIVGAPDSLVAITDTADTVLVDQRPYKITDDLEAEVTYEARDSINFSLVEQKAFLFGEAKTNYKDIELEAEYIEIDWLNTVIRAVGRKDSNGKIIGRPLFKDEGKPYEADTIAYNWKTKKGKINKLFTKEGEGYIHAEKAKKTPDDEMYVQTGKYTTCNLHHPHFYFNISRMKVVPDQLVVSGPANLVVEDVPTPLFVPFGLFPMKKGRRSGILIPEYGESQNLGFFLRNGGYYFSLGQHMDMALRGDIYSRGSWGLKASSNYAKRYRYNGNINLNYGQIREGERFDPAFRIRRDFLINIRHSQDPKARPGTRFSANINFQTGGYNRNFTTEAQSVLTNSVNSSVSYSKKISDKINFTSSFRHSQSNTGNNINFSLPDAALTVSRIQPFKRKNVVGKTKWYEKIGLNYTSNFRNDITIPDTVLFKNLMEKGIITNSIDSSTLEQNPNYYNEPINWNQYARYGVRHSIPLNTSFKAFKFFTVSPGLSYTERWYWKTIEKDWDPVLNRFVVTDTVSGFKAARDFGGSVAVNTRIYGMVKFRKSKIKAIRHVITPSFSFNYRPDFANPSWGYYKTADSGGPDSTRRTQTYSIFEGGIFGTPSRGRSGTIGININNNLEMKVFSKKDTLTQTRKIKIFDIFNIGASYNLAADSLNLSPISMSARTSLFQNKLGVNFNSSFDPYVMTADRRRIDVFEWERNKKLARLTTANLSLNTRFSSRGLSSKKSPALATEEELRMLELYPDAYVDFNIPWSFNVGYNLRLNRMPKQAADGTVIDTTTITQALNFSFDVNLTKKWKFEVGSGYDFVLDKLSYTTINIYRDLHCWQMSFQWIPFGFNKSYSLVINAKSALLQDLKLQKRRTQYDNLR